jgi:ubiquinone/menaquinone biosynthesis C-methylase UbiE
MGKAQSGSGFGAMAMMFKIRDIIKPRKKVLEEAGLKPGFQVLDFGCGPGGYILPTLKIIGASGKIYALDKNPSAINTVKPIIEKNKLDNVFPILSDKATGLPDNSLDIVLLYDILHHLENPDDILRECRRVLKAGGILSVSDHHMEKQDIEKVITKNGLFQISNRGKLVYNFLKM